jgi:hypothetical protein
VEKSLGRKSNEKICEELNSKEEYRARVIDWPDARIADEIAKGYQGAAARL